MLAVIAMRQNYKRTSLLDVCAYARQLDEDNIAQARLGVVCDSDCAQLGVAIIDDCFVVRRKPLSCVFRS